MNTIEQETLELEIPSSDLSLIEALALKLGWVINVKEKDTDHIKGIDLALKDVAEGNIFHAESVDDLFRQLNED